MTVEDALNGLLEVEAKELCGTTRAEPGSSGHTGVKLTTGAAYKGWRGDAPVESSVRDADYRTLQEA